MTPYILLWKSGCVKRWHCNIDHNLRESGDDTASHQWRVAMLLQMLHPLPSAHLLACALTHDVPEVITGDMPAPAKAGMMGEVIEAAESEVAAHWGLPVPSAKDKQWVKLCDMLDAVLWVKSRAPYLLMGGEWANNVDQILILAKALDVYDKVNALLNGSTGSGRAPRHGGVSSQAVS